MNKDIFETLIFRLGEDLKERQHEVIPIPQNANDKGEFLPCEYFGDINTVLNIPASRVVLFYQNQILVKVMLVFPLGLKRTLLKRLENLEVELPTNVHLTLQVNDLTDSIELVYQSVP